MQRRTLSCNREADIATEKAELQQRSRSCNGRSYLFSSLLQDISVEAIPKKEASLLAKRVETGANFLDLSEPLRLKQNAQDSQGGKAEATRGMAALFFIEQHENSFQLDSQGKGFGFAAVKVTAEDRNQCTVLHFVTIDPGGIFHFVTSRMPPSSLVELVPDALSDVDLAEQYPQEIEMPDRGEAGDR